MLYFAISNTVAFLKFYLFYLFIYSLTYLFLVPNGTQDLALPFVFKHQVKVNLQMMVHKS